MYFVKRKLSSSSLLNCEERSRCFGRLNFTVFNVFGVCRFTTFAKDSRHAGVLQHSLWIFGLSVHYLCEGFTARWSIATLSMDIWSAGSLPLRRIQDTLNIATLSMDIWSAGSLPLRRIQGTLECCNSLYGYLVCRFTTFVKDSRHAGVLQHSPWIFGLPVHYLCEGFKALQLEELLDYNWQKQPFRKPKSC